MIYAGSHISGAHYNPAVTFAVWFRGKMDSRDVFPYMITQVIAGVVAALAVLFVKGIPETAPMEISVLPALIAEILFTFALCLVILEVATSKATEGNSYYGIAMGFTVMAGVYAVGGVSGGVFNPAVAVGITVMDGEWDRWLVGYGWGDLSLEQGTGGTLETDTNLVMGSLGGRGLLAHEDSDYMELSKRNISS